MANGLQDLIDGQISGRRIGGGVSLPKGVFDVSETVKIVNVNGFTLGGQGPRATELRWVGPDDVPLFLLDHCQNILLEDFSILVGDGKDLLAAAWIQNTPADSQPVPGPPTSHVWWRNVVVIGEGRLTRGFHVRLAGTRATSTTTRRTTSTGSRA